jgi:hypothetical protein
MRVLIDTGRKTVELEADPGTSGLLELVAKALVALDYRPEDLIRQFSNENDEED